MTAPVFIATELESAVLGDVVELAGSEAHHAVSVQRLRQGDSVTIVNGRGLRVEGVIEEASREAMRVTTTLVAQDRDRSITVVQALAKGGRDEQSIEASTELGATRIVPWEADRSIVRWKGPKRDKARAQWQSLVTAATKQSRRAFVPEVGDVVSSSQLVVHVRQAVAKGEVVIVLHEAATVALTKAVPPKDVPLWFVVGPEGGISDAELADLAQAGASVVRLGPYVLRASSAAPAAIAAFASVGGDWDREW